MSKKVQATFATSGSNPEVVNNILQRYYTDGWRLVHQSAAGSQINMFFEREIELSEPTTSEPDSEMFPGPTKL